MFRSITSRNDWVEKAVSFAYLVFRKNGARYFCIVLKHCVLVYYVLRTHKLYESVDIKDYCVSWVVGAFCVLRSRNCV